MNSTDPPVPAKTPAVARPANKSPGRGARALRWVALFLLLAAAAGGYYWLRQVDAPRRAAETARLASLDQERARLTARLDQADVRLQQQDEMLQQLQAALAALSTEQRATAATVKSLDAGAVDVTLAWVLAEVEYLILAATQRLALEHDVDTALAALQAADARLGAQRDPQLVPLREQLARDIAALAAVARPDVEGLAIALAETVARVEQLPTKPIAENAADTAPAEAAPTSTWRAALRALWADLLSLIEIKDGELPDHVLFDPKLRYFLQQNLRLELSSARLAVLQRDDANFRAASKLALDLLDRYYDSDDAAVAAAREKLLQAQNTELGPTLPNVTGSLDAVRTLRQALRDAAVRP